MVSRWKKIAATLATAALLGVGTQPVLAQEHEHSHGTAAPAQLTLNNGQKWVTDDNLRLGMSRIRDALATELPAIRAGKTTVKQYRSLAKKTHAQIEFMVQNCKLEPQADAQLHLLLADVSAGADAMQARKASAAHQGAEQIAHALENYDAYFDHPGWQGTKHSH
jgi:hypothetical protein